MLDLAGFWCPTRDEAENSERIRKRDAFQYRDGLIIALLAVIPLRRRTVAGLRIGESLVRTGDLWVLDIPAKDTKTRRALDYPVVRTPVRAHCPSHILRIRGTARSLRRGNDAN